MGLTNAVETSNFHRTNRSYLGLYLFFNPYPANVENRVSS